MADFKLKQSGMEVQTILDASDEMNSWFNPNQYLGGPSMTIGTGDKKIIIGSIPDYITDSAFGVVEANGDSGITSANGMFKLEYDNQANAFMIRELKSGKHTTLFCEN